MRQESGSSLKLIRASAGHSRGGLVGQVKEDAVGQVEVQGVALAADLVGEGLGQEELQLPDRLSDQSEDPLGDIIPRKEEPRECMICSEVRRGASMCVLEEGVPEALILRGEF